MGGWPPLDWPKLSIVAFQMCCSLPVHSSRGTSRTRLLAGQFMVSSLYWRRKSIATHAIWKCSHFKTWTGPQIRDPGNGWSPCGFPSETIEQGSRAQLVLEGRQCHKPWAPNDNFEGGASKMALASSVRRTPGRWISWQTRRSFEMVGGTNCPSSKHSTCGRVLERWSSCCGYSASVAMLRGSRFWSLLG